MNASELCHARETWGPVKFHLIKTTVGGKGKVISELRYTDDYVMSSYKTVVFIQTLEQNC